MDWGAQGSRRRLLAFVLSVASYAAAVSAGVQQISTHADQKGCVDPHTLQYSWILLTGVVAGIAVGPWIVSWLYRGIRVVMSTASDAALRRRVRAVATSFILLGMAVNFLWIIPRLNLFIDGHRTLLVEADVILYTMGALSGGSWFALLDRQSWIGILVMLAMALMIISSVLSGHGWC